MLLPLTPPSRIGYFRTKCESTDAPPPRLRQGGKESTEAFLLRTKDEDYFIVTWCVSLSPSVMVRLAKPSSFIRSKKVASSATVRSWKKGDMRDMVVMFASR